MIGLHTVKQFAEKQRIFTEGALRNIIFNRYKNGLDESGAIQRVGRKILINEDKFYAWVNSLPKNDYFQSK